MVLRALLLFMLCGSVGTGFALKKWRQLTTLHKKIATLENRRALLLEKNLELEEKIASQSDPKWIELMLKKHLGLIETGQIKVVFNGTE